MCFSGRGTPIYNTHTAPSIKVHQDPIPWSGVVLSLPQASPPITSDMTKTRTRVWHKGYEDDMKESSASAFVPSRVIVDLSVYSKKLPDQDITKNAADCVCCLRLTPSSQSHCSQTPAAAARSSDCSIIDTQAGPDARSPSHHRVSVWAFQSRRTWSGNF